MEWMPHEEEPQLATATAFLDLGLTLGGVFLQHSSVDVPVIVSGAGVPVERSKDPHPQSARGLGDVAVLQHPITTCDECDVASCSL